jgi:glycosyltransferase involved in cell wall biosynthesis
MSTIRTLYISQTGLSEALGQSQVLSYLIGLANRGIEIEVVSFEPAATKPEAIALVADQTRRAGIRWTRLMRSPSHRFERKVYESGIGVMRGLVSALKRRPHIIHARAHFAGAMADAVATLAPGARLLFDCRGMLGEEYLDIGYWTKDRIEYRLLKVWERRAFKRAEGIVILTKRLREYLEASRVFNPRTALEIVPCCVDTDRFRVDLAARTQARQSLGIDRQVVLAYSGSLSGWYLVDEMARFMGRMRRVRPDTKLLLLTKCPTEPFRDRLRAYGVADDAMVTRTVKPWEMPKYLPAADAGLSFIKQCFSKLGSSPTKVAEYLACGLPVVLNGDIGDQAELEADGDAAVVLKSFSDAELDRAAVRVDELAGRSYQERAEAPRKAAIARFGLASVGVPRYERLYRAMYEA